MNDIPDTWKCFTCGEPGHLTANCPQNAPHPSVRAAGAEAPRARNATCDTESPAKHSNACRDGNRKACAMDWCQCRCHAQQSRPHKNDPEYLPVAEVLRYDPAQRCPEDRMHEIVQEARNRLFNGKPRWMALRMQAWHQVADSRRSRFSLPALEKPGMPDGVPFAVAPSLLDSSSDSSQKGDGLT